MRKWKADSQHRFVRCGHPWCSECRTKRGRNRGNRLMRHRIKNFLHITKGNED